MKKAQAAFEYLILISTALVIFGGILYYFQVSKNSFSNDIRASQLKSAVDWMVDSANMVCMQGEPASIISQVYIPSGVKDAYFDGNRIVYNLTVDSMVTHIHGKALCKLNGTLPRNEGSYRVLVKMQGDYVNITYKF
ncbi:MAG: hypothetical protein ACP5O8_02205 [Candidatus Aenigmatarchaeota archaeon]